MKRIVLVLFFVLFSCFTAFAEPVIYYLSLGGKFNTLNVRYHVINHYFYDFDEYSDAIMWRDRRGGSWTLQMNTKSSRNDFITFGNEYPLDSHYKTYDGENNSIGISAFMGAVSEQGYEYTIDNTGKLIYWASSSDFSPIDIAEKINENSGRIEINTNKYNDTYVYSNISREELLGIFIRLYLENIDYIFGEYDEASSPPMRKEYRSDNIDMYLLENLQGRTQKELAIFRNYIFARHNYKFQSNEWNSFFKRYYKSDYNGTRNNNEVMGLLTDYEKTVLNLIIELERLL
jgi:hypothetical protein